MGIAITTGTHRQDFAGSGPANTGRVRCPMQPQPLPGGLRDQLNSDDNNLALNPGGLTIRDTPMGSATDSLQGGGSVLGQSASHGEVHWVQKALKWASVIPVLMALYFYLTYVQHAWFFQDDFKFIQLYGSSPRYDQLSDVTSNLGRFISRNLYWNVSWQLFGGRSEFYFLVNFATILVTTWLIFKIYSQREGRYGGAISGLAYICSPAVLFSYTWLSNSQHLLGHLFVFLFVWLYLASGIKISGKMQTSKGIWLLTIFLCGLLSNVFVGLVLSLPILFATLSPSVRRSWSHWLWLAVASTAFFVLAFKLRVKSTGPYAMQIDMDTLQANVSFYFLSPWIGLLWCLVTGTGIVAALRLKDIFLLWMFLASPVFLIPYIFLEHQRYLNYGALTYLFLFLGLWSLLYRIVKPQHVRYIFAVGAIISVVSTSIVVKFIDHFGARPVGANQRVQVETLNRFNSSHAQSYNHYCFRVHNSNQPRSSVAEWNIPWAWGWLESGKAFTIFVDRTKTYELAMDDVKCDIIIPILDNSLIIPD